MGLKVFSCRFGHGSEVSSVRFLVVMRNQQARFHFLQGFLVFEVMGGLTLGD